MVEPSVQRVKGEGGVVVQSAGGGGSVCCPAESGGGGGWFGQLEGGGWISLSSPSVQRPIGSEVNQERLCDVTSGPSLRLAFLSAQALFHSLSSYHCQVEAFCQNYKPTCLTLE